MKKLKQIFALCLSLFCIFGLMTPVFAEGEDAFEVAEFTIKNGEQNLNEQRGDGYYMGIGISYTIHWKVKGTNGHDVLDVAQQYIDKLNNDSLSAGLPEDGGAGGDPIDGTDQAYYYFGTTVTPKAEGITKIEISPNQSLVIHAIKANDESNFIITNFDDLEEQGSFKDLESYYPHVECTDPNAKTWSTEISASFDEGKTFEVVYFWGYMIGADSGYAEIPEGVKTVLLKVRCEKNGVQQVEKIRKISLKDSPTTSPKLSVTNFDDVTVEAGTLDTDLWPKVAWDYANTKDWEEVLSVSTDGGKTWKNEYDLSPSTGGDTAAVPLKVSDSGRKYRLVFTYQGKELYNKTITVTVVGKEMAAEVAEGAPKTTTKVDVPTIVENAKKNNLLSEEQVAAVEQGGSTDVKVTVAKKEATAEEKKLVEAQLNSTNKVGMYLDLGVAVVVKDANGNVIGNDVAVSETGTPVTFTVALDDTLINTNSAVDRTYQVIRIHNGEVTVLPATFDAEGKTITFATDKFSTYALIYTDTPKKAKTPSTADTNTTGLYLAAMVAGLLACALVVRRKRA